MKLLTMLLHVSYIQILFQLLFSDIPNPSSSSRVTPK